MRAHTFTYAVLHHPFLYSVLLYFLFLSLSPTNYIHFSSDWFHFFAGIATASTLVDVDSSDDEPLIEIAGKGRGTPGGGSDGRSSPRPKSRPSSRPRDEESAK